MDGLNELLLSNSFIDVFLCYRHENNKLKEELSNIKNEFDDLAVKTGNEKLSHFYLSNGVENRIRILLIMTIKYRI